MAIRKLVYIFFIIVSTDIAGGQELVSGNYFRSPLSIPVLTSGSFGEIRANHLHSGIDYKTQGSEGWAVHAVADGYVSRIKISSGGYGNALYITHPNGYVSVYAHLKEFNNYIEYFAKQEQYKKESFAIDFIIDSNIIKVKKGEIIGFSGNSGRSFGAHLHFELREEKTEKPVNPLLYGFYVKDHMAPVIKTLKIYPVGKGSMVNGSAEPLTIAVKGQGKNHTLIPALSIAVKGKIAFGIEAYDLADGVSNKKGVYSTELFIDSICCFHLQMDKYDFKEARYINDMIDYKEYVTDKKKIIQTRKSSNNLLSCYKIIKNNGVYAFDDQKKHLVQFILKDEKHNTSKLSFTVESIGQQDNNALMPDINCKDKIYCNLQKTIITNEMILDFPVNAIFDSICLSYSTEEQYQYGSFPVYYLHNIYTPLLQAITIMLKADSLSRYQREKAVIIRINDKNELFSLGGTWEKGFVKASSFEFGKFTILIDTVPPLIKAVNISENKNMAYETAILLKISDNLSGIGYYRGTINGKWVLMEFDEKNKLLKYHFSENKTVKGKNTLELETGDNKGNISIYKVNFIR